MDRVAGVKYLRVLTWVLAFAALATVMQPGVASAVQAVDSRSRIVPIDDTRAGIPDDPDFSPLRSAPCQVDVEALSAQPEGAHSAPLSNPLRDLFAWWTFAWHLWGNE